MLSSLSESKGVVKHFPPLSLSRALSQPATPDSGEASRQASRRLDLEGDEGDRRGDTREWWWWLVVGCCEALFIFVFIYLNWGNGEECAKTRAVSVCDNGDDSRDARRGHDRDGNVDGCRDASTKCAGWNCKRMDNDWSWSAHVSSRYACVCV